MSLVARADVRRPPFAAAGGSWALLFGMALLMVGNGLQTSLLGLRASIEDFGPSVTGVVTSCYFLGFLAGAAVAPKVVERVGHVRVFAALASLASVAILVQGALVHVAVWGAMRLVTGLCYAGLYIVAESWLNGRTANDGRGRLLAIYMVVVHLGVGAGQLLLNVADPAGTGLFILASALISLALVPIVLSAARAPEFDAPAPLGVRRLFALAPLGAVGCFATGAANGAVFGMGAVYAGAAGLSVAEASLFMGAIFLGGIVCQWPIGRLSDRTDRRRVIALVTLVAAGFAVAADGIAGVSLPGLVVAAALFGGPHLAMYSLCLAHANDALGPRQTVAASSGLMLFTGVGAMFGPVAAGGAMAALGSHGFFWYLAAVHAAVGVFALHRIGRRAAKPVAGPAPGDDRGLTAAL